MAWSCDEYQEWVEKEIRERIKRKRQGRREKCKRKKCKKWCLCCNKWFCWIETFIYWVVEWIVRIVGEWILYVVCRIVTALVSLFLLGLSIAGWIFKWGYCMFWGRSDMDKLPMKELQIEVVIVHKDEETRNPITERTIDQYIYYADMILHQEARITVKRRGKIRETVSSSLWRLDASSVGAKIREWVKAIFLLIGRDNPRYLTVYAIGGIQNAEALHQPLFGSVFIVDGNPDTTLAHELGHALLAFWNAWHSKKKGHLMYVPWTEREDDSGWTAQTGVPKLSRNERCTMRRSRWLEHSWIPFDP